MKATGGGGNGPASPRRLLTRHTHPKAYIQPPDPQQTKQLKSIPPHPTPNPLLSSILHQVIDALRQIPVLPRGLVPERLKNTARDAADRM